MNNLDVLVDEVALEGLDGITLPTLWVRLKDNKDFTFGLEESSKAFLWRVLVSRHGLEFYELPEPRADVEPFNRYEHICEDDGFFTEPDNLAPDPYPVEVIESDEVMGSCTTFKTRKNITSSIRGEDGACLCTMQEAVDSWGRTLVVVASQSQRYLVLTGSPIRPGWIKTAVQYVALEGLGRSRHNGLITGSAARLSFSVYMGSSNTKLSFLIIKTWVKLGIAIKQTLYKKRYDGFCTVSMLVHLKRFHRAVVNRTKEIGLQLCDYLRKQPNKRQIISVICEELGFDKALMKRARSFNKGRVKMEIVPYRTMFPDAPEDEYMRQCATLEKKFHVLTLFHDFEENVDNSGDDDEDEASEHSAVTVVGDTAHYTWRYGESVNRQVYQFICAMGGTGLTLSDVVRKMGFTSSRIRRILKQLTKCGLLEPLRVSKDRLRMAVYVAKQFVTSSVYKTSLDTVKKEFHAKTTESLANVTMECNTIVDEEENSMTQTAMSATDSSFAASPVKTPDMTTSPVKTPAASEAPSTTEVISSPVTLTPAPSASLDPRIEATLADIKATFLPDVVENCLPDINLKTMQRANVLLDLVKKQRVIDTYFSVKQGMQKMLDDRGENEDGKMICIKTVRRLVNLCHAEGKINKFVVSLESRKKTIKVVLVCAKDVSPDDSTVQNIIQASKIRHFCASLPPHQPAQALGKMPPSVCESIIEWDHIAKPSTHTSTATDSSPPKEQRVSFAYASLPKMRRAALLHKFLWYLIYGYEGTAPSECDQVKPADQLEEGETAPSERIPPVYLDTWDWRRYLAPLRKHDDALEIVGRTQGTCLLGDLFMVMPLAIFCQCLHTRGQELEEWMFDSDKQLYPLPYLPLPILQNLLRRRTYLSRFGEEINRLAMMGLVSNGPHMINDRSKTFIYLHRRGMLLDTRSSLRGYRHTRRPEGQDSFPTLTYSFDTLDDVEQYWTMLQLISLNTDLHHLESGEPEENVPKVEVTLEESIASGVLENVKERWFLPGDQRGAGGLDSSFYVHLARNWINSKKNSISRFHASEIVKTENLDPLTPGLKHSAPPARKRKLSTGSEPLRVMFKKIKPKDKVKKESTQEKGEAGGSADDLESRIVPSYTGNRGGKNLKRKFELWHHRKLKVRPKVAKNLRPKKHKPRRTWQERENPDAKDQEALEKMVGERVSWTKQEMNVLLMCKVAGHVLMPGYKHPPIPMMTVRDILHEQCPDQAQDKTHMACKRKLVYCLKLPKTVNSVMQYVTLVKLDTALMDQYRGAIRKPGMVGGKYLPEPFIQRYRDFVMVLLEKFAMKKHLDKNVKMPLTVGSLKHDFNMSVTCSMTDHKPLQFCEPVSDVDVCKVALRDFLMSHVLCAGFKESRMYELYHTLRQYPDTLVREAFDSLLYDQMIVKRKKNFPDDKYVTQTSALIVRYTTSQRFYMMMRCDAAGLPLISCQFLTDIQSQQGQAHGEVQGHEDNFQEVTQGASEVQPSTSKVMSKDISKGTDNFVPLQGTIEAGHVAGIVALTAVGKLALQLELPNDVFSLPKSFNLDDATSAKEGQLHPGSDAEDEAITVVDDVDNDNTNDYTTDGGRDSQLGPPAKRRRVTDGEDFVKGKAKSIRTALQKRKGELSDDSSDDDHNSQDEDSNAKDPASESAADKEAADSSKLCSSLHDILAQNADSHLLTEEDDGFVNMRLGKLSVRFTRVSEPEEVKTKLTSHGLISLMRMQSVSHPALSKFDPNVKLPDNFVNVLLVNLCKTGVAFRADSPHHLQNAAAGYDNVNPLANAATGPVSSTSTSGCAEQKESPQEHTSGYTASQELSAMDASDTAMVTDSEPSKRAVPVASDTTRASPPGLSVDREVCEGIVSRLQKMLPNVVDMEKVWAEFEGRLGAEDLVVCKELYDVIDAGGMLGRTWPELKVTCPDAHVLQSCLDRLSGADAVLRVGVMQFRYVSFSKSRLWVTCTLKNNRGRGQAHPPSDQDDAINIENAPKTISTQEAGKTDSLAVQSKGENTQISDPQTMDDVPCVEMMEAGEATTCRDVAREAIANKTRTGEASSTEDGGRTEEKTIPRCAAEDKEMIEKETASDTVSSTMKRSCESAAKKKRETADNTSNVQPTSTYEKVRLVSRIWRKPEGSLNRALLRDLLNMVFQHLTFHPGCSLASVVNVFHPIVTPVTLLEVLEVLEELDCVQKRVVPQRKPASLFSKRQVTHGTDSYMGLTPSRRRRPSHGGTHDTSDIDMNSVSSEMLLLETTVDACLRLGQFLQYLIP